MAALARDLKAREKSVSVSCRLAVSFGPMIVCRDWP